MDIREDRKKDLLVLSLAGRIDAISSKMFEEKVLGVIDGGEKQLVIDLLQVDYVSSAGLRVFLMASKRLNAAGGKIALCSLQQPVKQVFDIVGFCSIFPILDSRDEAMNTLR